MTASPFFTLRHEGKEKEREGLGGDFPGCVSFLQSCRLHENDASWKFNHEISGLRSSSCSHLGWDLEFHTRHKNSSEESEVVPVAVLIEVL